MAQAFVPALRVERSVMIRRRRELPVRGTVTVRTGEEVGASDVVAHAELPGEVHIGRLAEKMGIEPHEVIKGLTVKVGDNVEADQVLCTHAGLFGLFRSLYRAPIEGTIDFITERTGHLGIREPPTRMNLSAYLAGRVVDVEEGLAVTIESRAAFIQGIFGVGGERQGVLCPLEMSGVDEILPERLPKECRGAVLVGGARPTIDALREAARRGAVGLVTGSIDDRTLAQFLGYDLGIALTGDEDVPLTLIITEGFGNLPISPRISEITQVLRGAPVSINGATQVRAGAVRPEMIVFENGAERRENADAEVRGGLEVGRTVRLIRVPYFGERGEVTELPEGLVEIETGALARTAKVRLAAGGGEVIVPRANLELI